MKENKRFNIKDLINGKSTTLVLIIILIALINIFGVATFFKLDLTASKAYTLSPVSKNLIKNLDDPVSIKVFFSPKLPSQYSSIERYLTDLLKEYKNASKGKFKYQVFDVDKEENKEMAASYGISPIQIRDFQNDRVEQIFAYMGIAILYGDNIETVPSITSTNGLEYKLTTTIQKMISKTTLLAGLDDKIQVTLFKTNALKAFNIAGFDELDDYLSDAYNQVNTENGGKLALKISDPSDSELDELAAKYGLNVINWQQSESADGSVMPAGRGVISILIEANGEFSLIEPSIARSLFGSYTLSGINSLYEDMMASVEGLVSANPKVAYLTGHGESALDDAQGQTGAAYFNSVAGELYDIESVSLSKSDLEDEEAEDIQDPDNPEARQEYEIPANVKTLIINSPKSPISDEELFKIDQFLLKGGSILLFFDSMQSFQQDQYSQPMFYPINNGLDDFLIEKGITVNQNIVSDKKSLPAPAGGVLPNYYEAPLLGQSTINQKNSITKNLNIILNYMAASISLGPGKDENIKLTTLLSSSSESWTLEGQINLQYNFPPTEDEMQSYPLAVLAEGKFKSHFSEIPASMAADDGLGEQSFIRESINPGKILVVGSSQITGNFIINWSYNQIQSGGSMDNINLLQNMVDYLNGNPEIAELRTKGMGARMLKESSDATRAFLRFFNIAGVPLLAGIAGIIVWRLRARRRKKIKSMYKEGGKNE